MARVFGAVAQYLARRFEGVLREVEGTQTVGVSAVQLVAHDPERLTLLIANHGAADVYVAPSNQVSVTRGIRLGAGGGSMSVNVEQDGNLPALEWWGISAAAGNAVYTLEAKREIALHDLE